MAKSMKRKGPREERREERLERKKRLTRVVETRLWLSWTFLFCRGEREGYRERWYDEGNRGLRVGSSWLLLLTASTCSSWDDQSFCKKICSVFFAGWGCIVLHGFVRWLELIWLRTFDHWAHLRPMEGVNGLKRLSLVLHLSNFRW